MKREELERLRAKYWAGKSSLEEERFLKDESDSEPYFSLLKDTGKEKMELDFDTFLEKTESRVNEDLVQVHPFINNNYTKQIYRCKYFGCKALGRTASSRK